MGEREGGPAFPLGRYAAMGYRAKWDDSNHGMSLRDYFAAAVLQGLVAGLMQALVVKQGDCTFPAGTYDTLAAESYEQADAMLKERSQ